MVGTKSCLDINNSSGFAKLNAKRRLFLNWKIMEKSLVNPSKLIVANAKTSSALNKVSKLFLMIFNCSLTHCRWLANKKSSLSI